MSEEKERMVRVEIPPSLYEAAEPYAKALNRSVTGQIRQLLAEFVERSKRGEKTE
jgi:hypothetical protein